MDKIGSTIVTIDIGTTKVGVIVSKVNKFSKLEIVHVETKKCEAVRNGEVVEPYKVADTLKNMLNQIETKYGYRIKSSYVNITNKYVSVEELVQEIDIDEKLGTVQKYDIDKLFNRIKDAELPRDKKIIDIIPIEYYDDNNNLLLDPINKSTSKLILKCQVFIAERTYTDKLESIFQYAGIKIDGIVFQIVSQSNLILTEEQKQKGTLVIDAGGNVIDIAMYLNNRLIYIENLDLGGDNVTSDLSIGLEIPFDEAEKIKRQYALALPKYIDNNYEISINGNDGKSKKVDCASIVEIIQARCTEIFENINYQLEEIDAKKYVQEVVLIGQGLNMISKIDILAEEILNKKVTILNYKNTNQIKNVNLTAYSMQEYVLTNNSTINSRTSTIEEIEENQKNNLLTKIVDKFKDFLYT